jgi:hypothetical protein
MRCQCSLLQVRLEAGDPVEQNPCNNNNVSDSCVSNIKEVEKWERKCGITLIRKYSG